ncbi:hypothetical protein SAMN04488052_108133 [Aquisalimonas asiatica]|uniref:ASCH domain-containing protein n=1 Tax=Aquisalimonas asiatica TaxID=406100 RepID=A0A1H8UXC8_9GAMM|nr:hypothetical protein SAMN04488052_108133 [Aquisalimonas asiatica]
MLFRKEFLEGIRAGAVTLAFRRWRRPSVREGGTLLTPVGQLSIRSVEPVTLNQISEEDAHRAGYKSRQALLDELQRRSEGEVYRIVFGQLRPDPRVELREAPVATEAEFEGLRRCLIRLDARAPEGAWTVRTLETVESHPGVRAGDLSGLVGQDKELFKVNVRKLKNLGLTESLGTGYRLSPRAEALLRALRAVRWTQSVGQPDGVPKL